MAKEKTIKESELKVDQAGKTWNPTEEEQARKEHVTTRLQEMRTFRQNVNKGKLENVWRTVDREYIPRRLKEEGKRVFASNDEKGWRSTQVVLRNVDDWRSDMSQSNAYSKVQTALAILIDQNPEAVLKAVSKKYDATTRLVKGLYKFSWELAKSKDQLKLFVFSLAKYGFAIGRTYPRIIRERTEEFDVYRENKSIWNCWIDDMTRPYDMNSTRDWIFREVYDHDTAEAMLGDFKNFKFAKPTSKIAKDLSDTGTDGEYFEGKHMHEVFFYEKREIGKKKSIFAVLDNGVLLTEPDEELPYKHKKLSCWYTMWNIRREDCPYGIGLMEAMREDRVLYDKLLNMTMDQLVLSIYKMFFYSGTNQLDDTGTIKLAPGIGKQVIDPNNVKFIDIPGPGAEAWQGLEFVQKMMDDDTGISATLEGEIAGKTAFEIAKARESALRRLKTPLGNIMFALEQEASLTIQLQQQIYSIPEIIAITDENTITQYLEEVGNDPELFGFNEDKKFVAKLFREAPLNLETDKDGGLTETEETQYIRIKPYEWDGMIRIDGASVLAQSPELDKQQTINFANLLVPLFQLPPEIAMKPAKQLVRAFDFEPNDWLPDAWLQGKGVTQDGLVINQAGGGQPQGEGQSPGGLQPQTVVPPENLSSPTSNNLGQIAKGLQTV